MNIKKYAGKYPDVTEYLMREGCLRAFPRQIHRDDLLWDEGIDIVYNFKRMTPERFRKYAEAVELAAFVEASRYKEYKWFFATLEIELGGPKKKGEDPLRRSYTAAKNSSAEVMVYGPGMDVGEEVFLVDRIKQILQIPERYRDSFGRQRPYKVLQLIISIRLGLRELVTLARFGGEKEAAALPPGAIEKLEEAEKRHRRRTEKPTLGEGRGAAA